MTAGRNFVAFGLILPVRALIVSHDLESIVTGVVIDYSFAKV